MATSQDEMLVRLGLDATSLERGTMSALDKQRKAASDYTSFWAKAIKEREDAELAADIRAAARANRAAALMRERQTVQAARQAVIDAEIAAGSGGTSWRKKGEHILEDVTMVAGGAAAVNQLRGAKAAAEGAEEMSRGGGFARVGRSLLSFGKAIARGEAPLSAFANEIMHFSHLFKEIGGGFLKKLGLIGALLTAGEIAWESHRTLAAADNETKSREALDRSSGRNAERLKKIIGEMLTQGKITKDEAGQYNQILSLPTYERVKIVQKALAGKTGVDSKKDWTEINRLEDEHNKKASDAARESMDLNTKYQNSLLAVVELKDQMAGMDKESIEYKQKQLELDDIEKTNAGDLKNINEDKVKLLSEAHELQERIALNQEKMNQEGAEYATIEDMAGRRFTERINKQYGKGGQFDLGAGNGDAANVAQDFELAQKQQLWDRIHGNIDAANNDRLRMVADSEFLNAYQGKPTDIAMQKMQENTDKMTTQLDELKNQLKHVGIDGID